LHRSEAVLGAAAADAEEVTFVAAGGVGACGAEIGGGLLEAGGDEG
jgi:hypothetical protein